MTAAFWHRNRIAFAVFWLTTGLGLSVSAQNGIFADFATSLGNFSCQLDYTNSPKAVANFIGLATGQRAWIDPATGCARTDPFYNGLTFHRVIHNFMSQSGSRNVLGTDGPGYLFVDEFSPLLRFDAPYKLAMANGGPNSNGSQFFLTSEPTAWLNDGYTIFGWLVSGTNEVNAINSVATDSSNKPLTNVIIQQISIRRVGTDANGFNINAQQLPIVTNQPVQITSVSNLVTLAYPNHQYVSTTLFASTNLTNWSATSLGTEIAAPFATTLQLAANEPKKFFRIAQAEYPGATFVPESLVGKTLTLNYQSVDGSPFPYVMTVVFTSASSGAYNFTGATEPGTLNYSYQNGPYRGIITLDFPYLTSIVLNFANPGALNFTAYYYNIDQYNGTFTLTGP